MRTDFQLAWPPKTIGGHSPVKWSSTDRVQIAGQFRRVLVQAKDEMPIQKFFEDNPVMLLRGLIRPHTAWVIPRPIFPLPQGGGGVPDFVLCEWSSVGPRWIIVELESPTRSPVTKSSIAAICYHAVEQINHYRGYLRDNAQYLRANGWPGIHGECDGIVLIGRRTDAPQAHRGRLADFRRQNIEVASYDRILDCESKDRATIVEEFDANVRALKRHR